MARGLAAAAALERAARACDDVIRRILAVVESGGTGQADQSVLPPRSRLHDLIGFSPKITESVRAFLDEFEDTQQSRDSNENPQRLLAKTLIRLEKDLLDLKQAVEWTAKNSGENWWMKRRQRDLGLESFVMLSYPGNGQEWLTSPMRMVDQYRALVKLRVLSPSAVNLEALSRLRIIKVPQFDGMHARWHPISLGHEVAHLLFDREWVDQKLRSLQQDPNYRDNAAVILASQQPQDRSTWYPKLALWLIEIACDTCSSWFYGNEGISALEAFLSIDLELYEDTHPSPDSRLATQRGQSINLPIEGISAHEASCRRAFELLASKVVEFARQDLQQITAESFSFAESEEVLASARGALKGKYSPPSQDWLDEVRLNRPSSIESGLVRALWSKCESTAQSPREAYYVESVSGCNRIEHAVNALQFAHLFACEVNRDSKDSSVSGKAEDGLRVPSVLWVYPNGIKMNPGQGECGGRTAHDVRLGRHFIVFRRNRITSLDFLAESALVEQLQEMVEIAWGKSLMLHPGELVLGATFESLVVADDACAQILSRSSLGRLGLLAATAVHVQPGFRGNLTLELVNLTSVPLRLSPGQRIAQIVAFPATGDREEYIGDYQDANWKPRFSKVGRDVETDVLRRIDESQEGGLHRVLDIGVL